MRGREGERKRERIGVMRLAPQLLPKWKKQDPSPIFRDLETVPTALGSYLKESLMDGCLCIHS